MGTRGNITDKVLKRFAKDIARAETEAEKDALRRDRDDYKRQRTQAINHKTIQNH